MHIVFVPVTDPLCRPLHTTAMLIVKQTRIGAPTVSALPAERIESNGCKAWNAEAYRLSRSFFVDFTAS